MTDFCALEAALVSACHALGRVMYEESAEGLNWLPPRHVARVLDRYGLRPEHLEDATREDAEWVSARLEEGYLLARLDRGEPADLGELLPAALGAEAAGETL